MRTAGSANILGANAWGLSLIVGDGTTFPHCIQHQVANLAGKLNGSSPVLAGAAVEGPNGGGDQGGWSPACARVRTNGVDVYAPFNGHGATVPGQRAVVLNTRAGDRPDGDLPARVRPPGGGDPMRRRTVMTGLSLPRSWQCDAGSASASPHRRRLRAATSPTVVTIQFDDGNADQYAALAILPTTACTRRST